MLCRIRRPAVDDRRLFHAVQEHVSQATCGIHPANQSDLIALKTPGGLSRSIHGHMNATAKAVGILDRPPRAGQLQVASFADCCGSGPVTTIEVAASWRTSTIQSPHASDLSV